MEKQPSKSKKGGIEDKLKEVDELKKELDELEQKKSTLLKNKKIPVEKKDALGALGYGVEEINQMTPEEADKILTTPTTTVETTKTTRTKKTIIDAPRKKVEPENKKEGGDDDSVEKELQAVKDRANEKLEQSEKETVEKLQNITNKEKTKKEPGTTLEIKEKKNEEKQEEESTEKLSGAFVNKKGPAKKPEAAKKPTSTKKEALGIKNEADFLAEIDKKAEEYGKAREALKYGSGTKEREEEAKESFLSTRKEYKNFLIGEKEKELKKSGKNKEEIAIEIESYKKGELFNKVFIQSEKRLKNLEVSIEKPEKKNFINKGMDWYGRQDKITKTVIAGSFITLGAVGFQTITPALAGAYLATRIMRGIIGAGVGTLAMEGSKKILTDPKKSFEEKMAELRKNFADDSVVLGEIDNQKNLLSEEYETKSRKRNYKLLGIGLVTGIGTSLSLSHFFGDQMDNMWSEIKDFDYQERIEEVQKGVGETISDILDNKEPEEAEMVPSPTIPGQEPITTESIEATPEKVIIPESAKAKLGDGITQIMKRQLEGDENLAKAFNYPPKTGSNEMYFLRLAQKLGYIDEAGNEVRIVQGGDDRIAYKLSGSLDNPVVEEYQNQTLTETHTNKTDFEGKDTEEYEKTWRKPLKNINRIRLENLGDADDTDFSYGKENIETEKTSQNTISITEDFSKIPMWQALDTTGNPPLDTGNAVEDMETLKSIRELAGLYPPLSDNETVGQYLERIMENKGQVASIENTGLEETDSVEDTPSRGARFSGLETTQDQAINTPEDTGLDFRTTTERFLENMKDIGISTGSEFWLSIKGNSAKDLLDIVDVKSLSREEDLLRSYLMYLEKNLEKLEVFTPDQIHPADNETIENYIKSALYALTEVEIKEIVTEELEHDMRDYFRPRFFWGKAGINSSEWQIVSDKSIYEITQGEFGNSWQRQGNNRAFIGYLINLSKETKLPIPTKENSVSVEEFIKKALEIKAREDYSPKILKVK